MPISTRYATELTMEIGRLRSKFKRTGDMLFELCGDCAGKYPNDADLLGRLAGIAMALSEEGLK